MITIVMPAGFYVSAQEHLWALSKPVDWDTNVVWTREPPSQLAPRQGAPCLRVSRISPFPPCLLIAMKLPSSSNSILCSSWTKYSSVTVTKMHLSASSIRANQSCAIVCPQNCPSLFPRAVCQTVPTSSSAGFKLSLKRYIQRLEILEIFRKILNFL